MSDKATATRADEVPAFASQRRSDVGYTRDERGMQLRQYAAIHLCVPDSGIPEIDAMIRQSMRQRIAGQAMQGMVACSATIRSPYESRALPEAIALFARDIADSMLAALDQSQRPAAVIGLIAALENIEGNKDVSSIGAAMDVASAALAAYRKKGA